MIKINPTPQSPSPSLITQHYLISKKYFTGNNLFSTPQIRVQKIFTDKPFIAYRRSPNLRDLLVRAKLKNPNTTPKLTSGTFRCNSTHGCLTCPYIDDARTSYTFSNTGETRQIKQHITCNSTNLTYMIECKKCKKTVYRGNQTHDP